MRYLRGVISDAALDKIFAGATLSSDEATAIAQLGDLAAGVDLDHDDDEDTAYDTLKEHVCALAKIDPATVPAVSPLPIDAEERDAWLTKLCAKLTSDRARTLAYTVSYLVVVADLELAPSESELLADLADALGFDDDRVRDLGSDIVDVITP